MENKLPSKSLIEKQLEAFRKRKAQDEKSPAKKIMPTPTTAEPKYEQPPTSKGFTKKKETVKINLPPKPEWDPPVRKIPAVESEKTETYITPKGAEDFFRADGTLEIRGFPESGIVEEYDEKGKLISRKDRDGNELPIDTPEPVLESTPVESAEEKAEEKRKESIQKNIANWNEEIKWLKSQKDAKLAHLENLELFPAAVTKEERKQIEKELKDIEKDIEKAEKIKAEYEAELISPKNNEKPSLWGKLRKNALRIGLATGLAATPAVGYVGGKKMGWWGGDAPEGKKVVEKAPTNTTETNKIYTVPAGTNLSTKVMEIEAKIRAELEKAHKKELAEKEAEYAKKLEEYKKTNSAPAPAVSPKLAPETVEERLAEIKTKLKKREEREAGKSIPPEEEITEEDQDFWNSHLK